MTPTEHGKNMLPPFTRMINGYYAEIECREALEEILGIDLLGIGFDDYDMSFEIYPDDDVEDVKITKDVNEKILALGAIRYWINFPDGSQRYMTGERIAGGAYNRWIGYNHSTELRRSVLSRLQAVQNELFELTATLVNK